MSYVVFALKWRPKSFDDVVGQDHIITVLKSAIEKNRLAHAYLFAGPRGVGKTSTARILARALNCKDGPTPSPCGTCPSCVGIAEGRSLDVIEIDGASNRGIDEIRTLRENVKFSPVQGRFKVYIIDEVHQITADGFNALLKTLEEPPEFVKFIFATTQPNKVIPTILSRCQRLDFRRIPAMEIARQLERIAQAEGIPVERAALLAIARASDGALRDAESVLDQIVSFSREKVTPQDVVAMLGLVEEETLFALTGRIIANDSKGALLLFNEIIDQGKEVSVFLSNLIEHFRNLMIAKVSQADPRLIDLPQESCTRLLEQAGHFTLEEIFAAFTTLVNTQEMAKRFDSMRIPVEVSLIKLCHDKRAPHPSANPGHHHKEPLQQAVRPAPALKASPAQPAVDPRPSPKQEPPQVAAEKDEGAAGAQGEGEAGSVTIDAVKESWQDIIGSLGKVKMSAATYLAEGSPREVKNNILTVSFPMNYSLHKESLERKENRAVIEKTFSQHFKGGMRVNFVLSKEAPDKSDGRDHPFVKSVLDAFDGRVIKEE